MPSHFTNEVWRIIWVGPMYFTIGNAPPTNHRPLKITFLNIPHHHLLILISIIIISPQQIKETLFLDGFISTHILAPNRTQSNDRQVPRVERARLICQWVFLHPTPPFHLPYPVHPPQDNCLTIIPCSLYVMLTLPSFISSQINHCSWGQSSQSTNKGRLRIGCLLIIDRGWGVSIFFTPSLTALSSPMQCTSSLSSSTSYFLTRFGFLVNLSSAPLTPRNWAWFQFKSFKRGRLAAILLHWQTTLQSDADSQRESFH